MDAKICDGCKKTIEQEKFLEGKLWGWSSILNRYTVLDIQNRHYCEKCVARIKK
jgi:hypothetical protein